VLLQDLSQLGRPTGHDARLGCGEGQSFLDAAKRDPLLQSPTALGEKVPLSVAEAFQLAAGCFESRLQLPKGRQTGQSADTFQEASFPLHGLAQGPGNALRALLFGEVQVDPGPGGVRLNLWSHD
jgi:hypothetical protein